MSSYSVRELREDDADAVAALFVESYGDARRMDGDEVRDWLRNAALKRGNLLVLADADDRPAAYFDVWPDPGGAVDLDVAAPASWPDAYDEAERAARARGGTRARTFVPDGGPQEALLPGRGYTVVRSSWTMEIEHGVEAPREAALADGLEIRPYRHPEDERRTYEAHQEAFADHWGWHGEPLEQWREFTVKARGFDPTLWFLAWDGDEVAGYALDWLERPGDPGYAWVGTLGVRRAWRRRGVGEALLRRSFAALHARGQRRVRLTVDADNPTGATRLYERVGMHVARRANTWELAL